VIAVVIASSMLGVARTLLAPRFTEPQMLRAIMFGILFVYLLGGLVAGYVAAKNDPAGTVMSGALAAGIFQLLQLAVSALILKFIVHSPNAPSALMVMSIGIAMVIGIIGASFHVFRRARTLGTTP